MTATAEAPEQAPETPDATAGVPEPPEDEFAAILPEGGRVELVPGVKVEVGRLKSREFLLLMRILTRGLGEGFAQIRLTTDDPDELQAQLVSLFMLAIPNAIEEFGAFLLAILKPVSESDRPVVAREAQNPDPEVLLDIFGVMIEQEKDDIVALVGKARAWIVRLQKTVTTPGR